VRRSATAYDPLVTFAPRTLVELASFWTARGGVNLGIVGDARHMAARVSYHLGRDDLDPDAYSIRTARDRAGLSNAASAIDLGKLDGSYSGLRTFSRWLVARAREDAPGTRDMREIIYSPDGSTVLRWDRERGFASAPRTGEASDSHLFHTHISFYRDAESRDHRTAFVPYWQDDMAQLSITDTTPATITIPKDSRRYMLDGAFDGFTFDDDYTRFSPYGVGAKRSYYASVDGKRVLRLVDPSSVTPIEPPASTDCSDEIAAATTAAITAERDRITLLINS